MQYVIKLKGHVGQFPAKIILDSEWEWGAKRSYEPFICKAFKEIERLGLGDVEVAPHLVWPVIPPWILPNPEVDMSVLGCVGAKEDSNYPGLVGRALEGNWKGYVQIYTDGSKDPVTEKNGFTFYVPQFNIV